MERSPHFSERIQEVRDMSQDTSEQTPDEREEVREAAKLLRMEAMLGNAETCNVFFDYVTQNPEASVEEYQNFLRTEAFISHPEVATRLAEAMSTNNEKVKRVQSQIEIDAEKANVSKESYLYNKILEYRFRNEKYNLKGSLEMEARPFAIVLYVENKEDFSAIDERQNIGGYYSKQHKYLYINDTEDIVDRYEPGEFPLIVINGGKDGKIKTLNHELAHAENAILIESLGERNIWGEAKEFLSRKKYFQLIDAYESDRENFRETEIYQKILNSALASAKNELLAEMLNTDNLNYISKLLNRSGVYDYFEGYKNHEPELYEALWKDYSDILTDRHSVASSIVEQYSNANFSKRINNFRWVLAQIPITKWEEQLDGALFTEEAKLLEYINDIYLELYSLKDYKWGERTEEEKKAVDRLLGMIEAFDIKNYDDCKPLLKKVRPCVRELEGDKDLQNLRDLALELSS